MPVELVRPAAVFSDALLGWYDAHARRLPWRAAPGSAAPHPYRVWLSEIMLQQTTVAAVAPYYAAFLARWPTVDRLAAAPDADVMRAWAGLGYYARARNLLAAARIVAASGWPHDEVALRALPGVGAYTAAAIASIAFGQAAVVVDGNVERVVARLFAVATPLPAARRELQSLAATLTPATRGGDYAQAMMDLGATVCTPRAPRCGLCPVAAWCSALAMGNLERFPVRPPKVARPVRHGTAFWLEAGGDVLVVRRPARDLLGGMLALPSGEWGADGADWRAGAPAVADWQRLDSIVRHVFTHFELRLGVAVARLPARPSIAGEWLPRDALGTAGLPTLFAKAAALALAARPADAAAT